MLEHLINTDYLWQNIRVLGGAYGVWIKFEQTGEAYVVSFRDPNLDGTYECYLRIPDYIESLDVDERTFRQYIIGAMNSLTRPRPEYVNGMIQVRRELSGLTEEKARLTREQIITATLQDIKALAPYLREWLGGASETVIGGEQKINASGIKFDVVKALL